MRFDLHYDHAVLGYLVSAGTYGLLLVVCITAWRRRLQGSGVSAAVGVQLAWSIVLALDSGGVPLAHGLEIATEYLRDLAWALVLIRCLRGGENGRGPVRAISQALIALAVVIVVVAALGRVPGEPGVGILTAERYWLWGGLALSIGGLVLVEQVARNTRSAQRWHLKHVWLAIGGLYAWDLCVYSASMLQGHAVGDFWLVRGFVDALLGGLLAIGLQRIGSWRPAVFLSARTVFFNATLLATSVYVLVMAAGSYFVRELGGSWGGAGQLLFLAACAVLLAVAVLSEQFRAWARVIIAKHLLPYRYDYRSEWQKLTQVLSQASDEPIYDRIARAMAGLVSCANGGLWLKDTERAFWPAGGDLAQPGAPPESGYPAAFFDHLLQTEWICDLEEARSSQAPKAAALPPAPAWMLENPRMWLVVPLICESALVGFVVLGQPLATTRLGWEEIDLLKAAARQVASFLAFEQAAKRLAEAHQFEAMNRLSAILMHDLRHLIAQQALVVQNAARHRGNPEFFDDAILTIENSVKRMTRLMDELRGGVSMEQSHRVELAELCAEAVRHCSDREPAPSLEVRDRGTEVVLNRERLLQVLEHVIRNAQDATPGEGRVAVHVHRTAQRAIIEVADTGAGMDAEFIRHRLFRPFDTTKGERGFGIGAYETREFVRKCGGSVEVDSTPGNGTRFIVELPLAPALASAEAATLHELQAN